MKKKSLYLFVLLMVCSMVLTACGGDKDSIRVDKHSNNKKFTIVTSFYPLYNFTLNVTKDIPDISVVNMTEPQTGCLHDYQFSAKDMKTLEKADVFVINGAGMEDFMKKVIEELPDLKVVEASKGINLLKDKKNGEENPHVWVSISGAIEEVKNITRELSTLKPEYKEYLNKNGNAFVSKLEAEKKKMHDQLDKVKNKDIVTLHEAFPYFAKEFGLNIAAVIEREPGTEPSAGEFADTIEMIKKAGIKVLFAEPQYSQKVAESIASQTGAKVYNLDPFVTGSDKNDLDSYIKTMDANLKVLSEALNN
ncbi:MAG: zinc ABC transporter substrate-binding protein [Bacillota bacterium]|nr:zinc ABC transporter substrate-binding protein [Bacillota bacterium]